MDLRRATADAVREEAVAENARAPLARDGAGALAKFDDVAPVRQPTAARALVDRILSMVKAGNLAAGDKLPPERVLAERFAVSRATVREALAALSVLGVVRARQGGGVYVSDLAATDLLSPLAFFLSLRDAEVDHLYAARRLIEGEIARLAAGRAGQDDLEALSALVERQRAARDEPIAYREVDTRFHEILADLAGNAFLARAAASLNVLGLEFRRVASETPAVIDLSIADHEAILAALARGDGPAAEAAMRAHMDNVLGTTKASMAAAGEGGAP